MMRRRCSAAAFAAIACATAALLPSAALAKPHKHTPTRAELREAKRAQQRAEAAAARKARAAKEAAFLKTADKQTLVTKGKIKPFYDPNDLGKPPVLNAPSAVLMDAATGRVLWAKNPDARRFPASTTKILTSLLFIEHTRPTDVVTCMDPSVTQIEESSLHIRPWEKFSAEDLLYGTLLRSANDGAVVMAEYVAGSVPKFAALMNARAAEIGATHSHFVTPNGLPEPRHYSTARDLALIARAAMQNPRFADAVGTPERHLQRSKLTSDSWIVAKTKPLFYDKFPGADGVKSGFTNAAGHCFVGSATRDGRRLISVVLGARHSATDDTIPLLSWGFRRFPATVVAKRGQAEGMVRVAGGATGSVPALAGADLVATQDALQPAGTVTTDVVPAPGLQAPIQRGQEVGKLVAKVDGKPVAEAPLIANGDVPKSPLAGVVTAGFGGSGGILAGVCGAALAVLIGFRYGPAALRFAADNRTSRSAAAAAAAAPSESARGRGGRLAAARRGDHRLG